MWALKHSEVVLGPQQIVDCDKVDQGKKKREEEREEKRERWRETA